MWIAVTSLEAVVVQLQDSCREARTDANDLRQENQRLLTALETLRHECRERDKYLRALWHAKKSGDDPHWDDFPPAPPSFNAVTTSNGPTAPSSSLGTPVTNSLPNPVTYPPQTAEGLDPRVQQYATDPNVAIQQAAYHDASANAYNGRSPVMPFMPHDGDVSSRHAAMGMAKMNHYSFNGMTGHARDNTWHPGINQGAPSGAEPVAGENGSSHSPAFMSSPTITSTEVPYGTRYPTTLMDAHKNALSGIDQAPYLMNNNDRSISPSTSSPHNGSSSSINSQFQFVFPNEGQDRTDADYHRRLTATAPELTLHGGTADVSVYGMNRRRTIAGPERPMLGSAPAFRPDNSQGLGMAESSKASVGAALPSSDPRGVRRRRNTDQSNGGNHSSRSPSPSAHPPISSTLAVIKAQAFGALRRTRARPKKATEGAAKMAMEVLEARGIGLGINAQNSNKRPRLSDEDSSGTHNQT